MKIDSKSNWNPIKTNSHRGNKNSKKGIMPRYSSDHVVLNLQRIDNPFIIYTVEEHRKRWKLFSSFYKYSITLNHNQIKIEGKTTHKQKQETQR